jgi:hypothetical protein
VYAVAVHDAPDIYVVDLDVRAVARHTLTIHTTCTIGVRIARGSFPTSPAVLPHRVSQVSRRPRPHRARPAAHALLLRHQGRVDDRHIP